jgi:cytochrome c
MSRATVLSASAAILVVSLLGAPQADQTAGAENAEKLIKASDCSSCHAVDHQVVGPSYGSVAKRYAGQADAIDKLANKIRDGGSGMTPHPDLKEAERREMAKWVLAQTERAAAPAQAKLYPYTLPDGTKVQLDFPVFVDAKGPNVTKDVFHGYQLYNSYCYRCHGTDATGGQLGPDLRRSLSAGMKQPEFLSVAMTGREEQGMPEWAGFLSEADVVHVYEYVKARSLDLVPSGRPASEQD